MKTYKVLLVEDDVSLAKVVSLYLAKQNIIIDHAENGFLALDKLKDNSYDGIISDVDMPECNGLEFIKKLRKSKNYIPVLFYSGRAEDSEAHIVHSYGAEGILSKQQTRLIGPMIIKLIEENEIRQLLNDQIHRPLTEEFIELYYNVQK